MTDSPISPIRPPGDKLVVRVLEDHEQMYGEHIHIPDVAKEKPMQGLVIAAGPGKVENGVRIPMEVHPGDTVLYSRHSGVDVSVGGVAYLILRESDVLGIVVPEADLAALES